MTDLDLFDIAAEIREKAKVGYLATVDENGFPHIRAVDNLICPKKWPHAMEFLKSLEDKKSVYISTNTSSIKFAQIKNNDKVAIYYCIPDEFKGIMIQGLIKIINDISFKEKIWCKEWTMYYPKGFTDPDFTILKIEPKYLKSWYKSGKHELKINE
ncbi:MAG: pyridoxamine 5'-phosphate oxidase family protein [Candidatus Thorarchaeota archaeon]